MPATVLLETDTLLWVDILNLQRRDIPEISEQYGINPLLLEDCIDPNHLPKYEDLEKLDFILMRQNTSVERAGLSTLSDVSTKIGVFIGEKFLMTVHRIENYGIIEISEKAKAGKFKKVTPAIMALKIAHKTLDSYDTENQFLLEQLDKMELEIFTKTLSSATQLKRLYGFKRKIGLNLKVLNLSSEWVNFFQKLPISPVETKNLKDKFLDAQSDFDHLNSQSTNLISLFLALSDQRNNASMEMLSRISIYFLPITFIAGVYGMNFKYMPELVQPYGYFFTLFLMALVVIITFIYLQRKKI